MNCPKCGKEMTTVLCGHCRAPIPIEQIGLMRAVVDKARDTPNSSGSAPQRGAGAEPARPATKSDDWHPSWEHHPRQETLAGYLWQVRLKIKQIPLPEKEREREEAADLLGELIEQLTGLAEDLE